MIRIELVLDRAHQGGRRDLPVPAGPAGFDGRHDRRGRGQHGHAAPRIPGGRSSRRPGQVQPVAQFAREPGGGVALGAQVQAGVEHPRTRRAADRGPDPGARSGRGERVQHAGQFPGPERHPDHDSRGQLPPPRRRRRGNSQSRSGREQRGGLLDPLGHPRLGAFEQHPDPQRPPRAARPVELHRGGHQRGPRRRRHRDRGRGPVGRAEFRGHVGHPGGPRVQPERRLGDQAKRARRSSEQLAEVVAGHVLDHLAARMGDHPVGAHHGQSDQEIARGAVAQPAWSGGAGGDHPAHGRVGRGVQRELLARRREHRGQLPDRDPGLHLRHQVTGRVLDDLVHRTQVHDQVTSSGRLAPGQPQPGAAWHHRQPVTRRRPQQRGRLSGAGRRSDEGRRTTSDRIGKITVAQRRAGRGQR